MKSKRFAVGGGWAVIASFSAFAVYALQAQQGAAAKSAPSASIDASQPREMPEDASSTDEPSYAEEMAELNRRGERLEAIFLAQGRDAGWADVIEALVRQAHTGGVVGVSLVSASCRTTMCRFEFTYGNREQRIEHLTHLGQAFSELPEGAYAYPGEPEAHDRAIAYFARQGTSLSSLEERLK